MRFNAKNIVALSSLLTATFATPSPLRYANILTRTDQVKESYDYVVIGGGTAGLTVSDRLTESGKCQYSIAAPKKPLKYSPASDSVLTIEYGDPSK
jgi:hypothetical protein